MGLLKGSFAAALFVTAAPLAAQSATADEREQLDAAAEAIRGSADEGEYHQPFPTPKSDSYYWIGPADYPPEAWVADMEGEVAYTLQVDERGIVTGCTIDKSSGHALLDNETCLIASANAEFNPARDENGAPFASSFSGEAYWRKREPEWGATFSLKISFVVNERGEQLDCKIIDRTGEVPAEFARSIDRDPCPGGPGFNRVPFRDEKGIPVEKRVVISVGAEVFDSAE